MNLSDWKLSERSLWRAASGVHVEIKHEQGAPATWVVREMREASITLNTWRLSHLVPVTWKPTGSFEGTGGESLQDGEACALSFVRSLGIAEPFVRKEYVRLWEDGSWQLRVELLDAGAWEWRLLRVESGRWRASLRSNADDHDRAVRAAARAYDALLPIVAEEGP